ncbi:hypothetical protein ACXJY6_11755 [Vibrio sp. RC27]
MSRIITMFEANASVDIGRLITDAIHLEVEKNLISPAGDFSNNEIKIALTQLTKSINRRVDSLNKLYTIIDDSKRPEELFDTKLIEELVDAAVMTRAFKDILKTQYHRLVRRVGLESEAVQSCKVVYRASANLYASVMNLISLQKQLSISNSSKYKQKLALSPDVAEMLKNATNTIVAKDSY